MKSARYTCIVGKSCEIRQDITDQMHSERKRCLVDNLGWDLKSVDGLEFDQFDRPDTEYIIVLDDGLHAASLRIHCTPSNRSLISAISGCKIGSEEKIWEVSRFISSNFSFSTSEYILFSAIHYVFRDKNIDTVYTTLSKSIGRMYKMFGMTLKADKNINIEGAEFQNYRIDTSCVAFEKFMKRVPDRDAAYLQMLGRKWECTRTRREQLPRHARIARPQFIENLIYEEMLYNETCMRIQ